MSTLVLQAPAKLNLYLEVLGRRDDGFHELVTVLTVLDLADELSLSLRPRDPALAPGRPDLTLTVSDQGGRPGQVPAGPDNLVVRAAAALLAAAGLTDATGVDLELVKRIPAGGGLGGGSSDAAATLQGLNRLLGEPLAAAALSALAADLGSDVPFFLTGGTALCTGRGEQVRPLPGPGPVDVSLLLPPFGVATPAVYGALRAGPPGAPQRPLSFWESALSGADAETLESIYSNDLEEPARQVEPRLARLLATEGQHLSGSGSTIFAYHGSGARPALIGAESGLVVHGRCGSR